MDVYRDLKKEIILFPATWELLKPYKGFPRLYLKFMYRIKLLCRVLKKLKTYKRKAPEMEAVETIVESDNRIEVVNTIRKELRPIYSLKIKCKFQIHDWALDIVELTDIGCSNIILDKKLVPQQYQNTNSFYSSIH